MNGTAYYPPTEGADPLSLLALSVPNYLQQQSTPQPQLSQYPYPQQQQQNDSQAAASYLFAQHGQPQTSTNYFPSPGDPSSSSAVPSNMTSATQLTLSPTMHNQNPAFLAPERAVHSEWYPMFSPSILSPLGLSSSSQPLLNGTPSSSSNLNNVSSNGDVSYFPSKPWAPSPGSFFDSLTTGLSPHPEAEFLFDGMSDMDAEGSVEELEGEAVVEPDAEKQNRDNTLAAEKVVLGAEWSNRFTKSGLENYAVKESDPYFISGDRFLGCYSVEHWQIPPISTLTKIARRTLTQLAPHLPMIHVPTFVLKEAPGCLAFSMCTVGGPRRGGGRWDVDRGDPSTELGGVREENDVVKRRPVQNALFEAESSEEDGWDGIKSVVKREKTDMLIKSFTRSRGVLFTEYNVGLLQALILYNAPAFLSDSQGQRMSAQLGLGTIVNIARQVGIFDPTNGHVAPDSDSSKSGFTCEERTLPAIWKRWARWEGIRRTAYIVFLLDTVACLESSTALHIASSELSSFPLPASESIWEAPTAEAWSSIVTATGHSYSLGDIVTKLTTLLATGESDCLAGGRTLLGPFGWLVTIVVLVREVLDFGEGKIRDPNMRWMAGVPQERVGEELQTALMRWRRGWDYDDQCRRVDPPSVYSGEDVDCCFITPASNSNGSTTGSTSSPETTSTPSSGTTGTGSGTSSDKEKDNRGRQPYSDEIFCREALPFWWFAKILLDTILPPASSQSSVPAPFGNGQPAVPAGGFKAGVNQFKEKGIVYRDVLNSARTFSRAGEGRFFG
ncbi:hypothetical protein BDY24DRAFT_392626 [Mrakia frigida]|uniref:fungal specific transcription factor domain-containing protein n=1 Tax=Mrakia frigida TaxID=29902 RepID=UPI003FCC0C7E